MESWRRARFGMIAIVLVLAVGTSGYVALGFSVLDAAYQTVTTITTVGFREVERFGTAEKVFTIVLCIVGVSTALYTFGVTLESLVEGHVRDEVGRRRMDRKIGALEGHVIICGWGRVGRALAQYVGSERSDIVVIDRDPDRLATVPHLRVGGDATDDAVLKAAGIDRAHALVAALNGDADNLFVTMSGRALRPDLFIVARVRTVAAEDKMRRAGADRVVNPQQIGGQRMAAFVRQPHVVEFLDVVMHDGSLEFRLEELLVPKDSPIAGKTLRETHIRDETGALVLAIREGGETFHTNPGPDTGIDPGDILIAIGTADQLDKLKSLVG